MVDDIAEEGGRLPLLTRHLAQDLGLVYPKMKDLDRGFIDVLATPEGTMSYDQVFERAKANVRTPGRNWGGHWTRATRAR